MVVLAGICALGGCRKAADGEDEPAAAQSGGGAARDGSGTPGPTAAEGGREVPSKLSREDGRRPDGRKAPAPMDYKVGKPLPGKEGYIFNPFTNNPVDVRGIPSGTLVRDPADPDKEHIFRVP